MSTATITRSDVPGKGFAGSVTHCYRLSEPYEGVEFVTVTVSDLPKWNYLEVLILPASDADGAALTAPDGSLAASITLPLCTHAEALAELGYTVAP